MENNYFQARAVGACGMKSKKTPGTISRCGDLRQKKKINCKDDWPDVITVQITKPTTKGAEGLWYPCDLRATSQASIFSDVASGEQKSIIRCLQKFSC